MCDRSHLSKEDRVAIEGIQEFRDMHGRLPRHRAEFVSWAAEQYSRFLKANAELKERCPDEWLQHAKEKVGIGRSRAYELMAIGTGVLTVEQVRENTRRRVENHRSRPLRNGQIVWVASCCDEINPDFVPACDCCVPYVSKDGRFQMVPRRIEKMEQ